MSSDAIYDREIQIEKYPDIIPYDADVHPRDPKEYPYGKVKDTDSFIRKVQWIHGVGRFDYSDVDYVRSSKTVKIACHRTEKHDKPHVFEVTPNSHITKQTICPKCSGKYKWTTEEWIEEAEKKWEGSFDYSEVVYKGAFTKVWVTHKDCGNRFSVTADNHMRGRGCPKCKNIRTGRFATVDEYIEELVRVRGDVFDTSRVVGDIRGKRNIELRCKKHDEWFLVDPLTIIDNPSKNSCKKCIQSERLSYHYITHIPISPLIKKKEGIPRRPKPRNVWVGDAMSVHDGRGYDYSLVDDQPMYRQNIYCPKHDHHFFLTYTEHVRIGRKCRFCAAEDNVGGYKLGDLGAHTPTSPATMYHVKITNKESGHEFYKVGVTKQKYTNSRFTSGRFKQIYAVDILQEYKSTLLDVLEKEDEIIRMIDVMGKRFLEHELKGSCIGGWTECYRACDLEVNDMVVEFFSRLEHP